MLHAQSGYHWPIDLRRITHLRSLQIELDSFYDDARLVMQMLSQISSGCIEDVGLAISAAEDGVVVAGENGAVGCVGWDEIDAALQHSSFSGLKTVNV
jgi:hypothetical protein